MSEGQSVQGPYPTIVKKSDGGREAAVVQAFAYTKYLGKIRSVEIRPKV